MTASFNWISARGPVSLIQSGGFQLGGVLYAGPLLITSEGVFATDRSGQRIVDDDILGFLDTHAEARGDFLLLGTGAALRFPLPTFREEIERRGLGLEAMDTSAACRTYNVLVGEGRLFTAVFLPLLAPPASP